MKIFLVTPFNTGCSKWRAEIPAKYLKRRGHTVHFFEEFKSAGCPDVIVFARTYIGDLLPLYRWAKSKNIRTVYDTDDAIDLVDESNPAYAFSRTRIEQARFMMANADVITTTTPELAGHLRRWNRSVSVIPNSIDPEEWPIQPREPNCEMRIGWAGGNTHYRDVALVMDALSDLQATTRFKFVVHGLTTMPSVRELYESRLQTHGESFRNSAHGRSIRLFLKKSEGLNYEFHPSVETRDYVPSLCNLKLDIGVAPLAGTPFNRHRSCIKYYEYVMSGAVALASNVLPYSSEMDATCEHTLKGWKNGLLQLLNSDLRSKWESQREWIMANRNIERNVLLWEQVLRGQFPREVSRALPEEPVLQLN